VKNGGRFNLAASNQLYGQNAKLSLANNPRFYGGGYTLLVILGEVCRILRSVFDIS
jgi:hypothetical protein